MTVWKFLEAALTTKARALDATTTEVGEDLGVGNAALEKAVLGGATLHRAACIFSADLE